METVDPQDAPADRIEEIVAAWQRERPELDPSPLRVIARLHRLANALTARLTDVYARFGLTEPEFDLLATLRRAGAPYARPAGDLAEHTMVTTGGLTKRVDRLIVRGLVSRDADEDDARRRLVRLTPQGLDLIDRAFAAHMANERHLVDGLGDEDAAALEPILARWLLRLGDPALGE